MNVKILSLLLAGSFFLGACGGGKVKPHVTVNGIDVGGMSETEALERVREGLLRLPLAVETPAGVFEVPVDYRDDAEEVLKHAEKGGNYTVTVRRGCACLEQFADMVCLSNAREPKDAVLGFGKDGFTYAPEESGLACDRAKLIASLTRALNGRRTRVSLSVRETSAKTTEALLRARTRPIATFGTTYEEENAPRSHNIALAASKIAGTVLGSGETFSFNACVGARTAENGFEEAAVIREGEFAVGVGGGVCQVSTTLFGAALRAGLKIEESHAHSLSVSYVPPSQDAMVSEQSDLRFTDPYPWPVYILGKAEAGTVTFTVYGMPDGRRYEVESAVLFSIGPPAAKVVEGSRDRVLRAAREGLCSESYLLVYEGEKLLSRTLLRRDTYAPLPALIEHAA